MLKTPARLVWICAAMAASATIQLPAVAPQSPRVKQLLVTVVADEKGPASYLSVTDFVVVEDKAPREVIKVELAVNPLSVALLLDTSQPPMGAPITTIARDLRRSLVTFVKTIQAISPDAQISYVEFGGAAVTRVPFTTKTGELEKVLRRFYPDQSGGAVLLEALTETGARLAKTPPPRRAVVTVDFNSPESSGENQQLPAIDAVEKSGATVWSITVGSRGSSNTRETVLNALTERSGGQRQRIIDTSSLEVRLKSVAHTLLSQYEVTYIRPENVTSVTDIQIDTKRGLKALKARWMR